MFNYLFGITLSIAGSYLVQTYASSKVFQYSGAGLIIFGFVLTFISFISCLVFNIKNIPMLIVRLCCFGYSTYVLISSLSLVQSLINI